MGLELILLNTANLSRVGNIIQLEDVVVSDQHETHACNACFNMLVKPFSSFNTIWLFEMYSVSIVIKT